MRTSLVTAPTEEWITSDEVKVHPAARIDSISDDVWIDELIKAARLRYEELTQCVLMSSTWDLYLDGFPDGAIELPAPLTSVTSLKYQDTSDAEQTWAAANYVVDTVSNPVAHLSLAYGCSWPSVYAEPNVIVVRYVAGYTGVTLPAGLRTWLACWVAAAYDGNQAMLEVAERMMRVGGRWAI